MFKREKKPNAKSKPTKTEPAVAEAPADADKEPATAASKPVTGRITRVKGTLTAKIDDS